MLTRDEMRLYLIRYLLDEQPRYRDMAIPEDRFYRKVLLRALFSFRRPVPVSDEFLRVQDEYLKTTIELRGITDYKTLEPIENGIYLWQGDITALSCDAIVNAAGSSLLGCFFPDYRCADNAIHTFAGVKLRAACAEIIARQGHEEMTGGAKLTPAFNLPSRYVIHTVGPEITGEVTDEDAAVLASCYRSSLALAQENGIKSVAFCCLSTGENRFPGDRAAEIAVDTVRRCKGETEVIFSVFTERDFNIYRALLG